MAKNVVDDFKRNGLWAKNIGTAPNNLYTRSGELFHRLHKKIKNPTGAARMYENCSMSDEFHDFQFFSDWCQSQIGYKNDEENGRAWSIDKDFLKKGNSIYHPELCCFVPQRINTLCPKRPDKKSGFPPGVSFDGRYFQARSMSADCKRVTIGAFRNPMDAFLAYKKFKEEVIKIVATEYKSTIDPRLFDSLMSWEVEVEDHFLLTL